MSQRRRRRVEPTEDWEQLALLCKWPEQVSYEEIRPLDLFGTPTAERSAQIGTPERTLYSRRNRFVTEGMESPFGSERAKQ
jgi:hypothetical protein